MIKVSYKRIFQIVAVIVLLIFFHYTKILSPLERIIINIIKPFSGGVYSVSSDIRVSYNDQGDKRDLLNAINLLEEDNNRLIAENSKLKSVQEENDELRKYLDFFDLKEYNYLMSNIIAEGLVDDVSINENSLIIDKGSNDGVVLGLPVLNAQGIMIGKITKVEKDVSKISLLTSGNCKIAASIQGESNTIGVTEGELGLTLKMNFIPQKEEIKIKDIVVTSGLEKEIPKGLVIGEVTQITNNKNDIWQSVVIEPLVDFRELDIVTVITP